MRQAKSDKNDACIRYLDFRGAILIEENRRNRRAEQWAKVESFIVQQVQLLLLLTVILFLLTSVLQK